MKKILFLSLLMLGIMLTGCNSCSKPENKQELAADSVEVGELIVENTVSTDREYMFMNHGGDYRWYETCILLKDFMDEECDGTVEGVSNIFQYITNADSTSFDVNVVLSAYGYGKHTYEVKEGFWVGDSPMNEDSIKVTYKQAFALMMETNYIKPHSRHCVLRKEVGPVDANPQYIFGNKSRQVYVDAVTGDVTDENPAFHGFGMPLGEWP